MCRKDLYCPYRNRIISKLNQEVSSIFTDVTTESTSTCQILAELHVVDTNCYNPDQNQITCAIAIEHTTKPL